MALDMQGLFQTPGEIRAKRLTDLAQQQQALGQMGGSMSGLLGQVAGGGNIMGQMLAEGIAKTAGLKTQEEAQAAKAQEVLGKIDPKDPQSYFDAAERMQSAGLTKAAFAMMQQGQELYNTQFKQGLEERQVEVSEGGLALQRVKQGHAETMDLKNYTLALRNLGIKKQEVANLDSYRKKQLELEMDRLAIAQAVESDRVEDKDKQSKIDEIVSDVSYVAGEDFSTYNQRVAETLKMEGYGAEADKYLKLAEDSKAKKLSTAKPVVTTIDDHYDPTTGKVGTLVLVNGQRDSFYETTDEQEMSTTMEKIQDKASSGAAEANSRSSRAQSLITTVMQAPDFNGGTAQAVEESIKNVTGLRDQRSQLITAANMIRVSEALEYLPPGAASDKDVELVMSGVPPENMGKEELLSFARGVKKLADKEAAYFRAKDNWISKNGNLRGFGMDQRIKAIDTAVAGLPEGALDAFEASYANPQPPMTQEGVLADFQDMFGFNPIAVKAEKTQLATDLQAIQGGRR
jgi:hypothetical protein